MTVIVSNNTLRFSMQEWKQWYKKVEQILPFKSSLTTFCPVCRAAVKPNTITIFPIMGETYYGLLEIYLANCDYVLLLILHWASHACGHSQQEQRGSHRNVDLRRKAGRSECLHKWIYSNRYKQYMGAHFNDSKARTGNSGAASQRMFPSWCHCSYACNVYATTHILM